MHKSSCILLIAAMILTTRPALAQGDIDWSSGVLKAVGIGVAPANMPGRRGKAMARRAAVVDAQRNLLETLKGVSIDAETTVTNLIADDRIHSRVKGVLRGARQVGDPVYHDDGSVEVTLAVSTRGDLSDALLPPDGFGPDRKSEPEPDTSQEDPAAATGLIVDASGMGLQNALAPKVVDEDENLVYGAKVVDRDAAVEHGIAVYEKDLEAAKGTGRTGSNPLVVKATRALGRRNTNVMISNADAERVRAAAEGRSFLNQCQVVLVAN